MLNFLHLQSCIKNVIEKNLSSVYKYVIYILRNDGFASMQKQNISHIV